MLPLLLRPMAPTWFTSLLISSARPAISFMPLAISAVTFSRFFPSAQTALLPSSISPELFLTARVISLSFSIDSRIWRLPAFCSSIAFRICSS